MKYLNKKICITYNKVIFCFYLISFYFVFFEFIQINDIFLLIIKKLNEKLNLKKIIRIKVESSEKKQERKIKDLIAQNVKSEKQNKLAFKNITY